MKMIMIENEGEVDVLAFTLMGASTKRNTKGKIGFFGSGNKYAIANLMRRGIAFRIFAGESEIVVDRVPVDYRENKYDRITFAKDGVTHQTSITTAMGPKWEPWYIVRELYCNAVDEGNERIQILEEEATEAGVAGKTRIFIELTEELFDVVNHWNAYFTNERKDLIEHIQPDFKDFETIKEVKVYHKYDDKFRIYRKGVLVYSGTEKSIFDYDLATADINEERILSNIYSSQREIGVALGASGSSALIKKVLKGSDKFNRAKSPFAEKHMNFEYQVNKNKENWTTALDGCNVINQDREDSYSEELKDGSSLLIDGSLAYALSELPGVKNVMGVPAKGLNHSFRESNPTMDQSQLIDKGLEFLTLAGFDFGGIEINTVKFDDYAISGMADIAGRKIYIGQNCFDKGLKYLVTTLMEEHSHIESRMKDETRAFQNFLIDRWLCAIEDKLEQRL